MSQDGFGPSEGDIALLLFTAMGATVAGIFYCSPTKKQDDLLNRVCEIADTNKNRTLEDEELYILGGNLGIVTQDLESRDDLARRIQELSPDRYRQFIEKHDASEKE